MMKKLFGMVTFDKYFLLDQNFASFSHSWKYVDG